MMIMVRSLNNTTMRTVLLRIGKILRMSLKNRRNLKSNPTKATKNRKKKMGEMKTNRMRAK